MKVRDRISLILLFNDNLAFSFWELFGKVTGLFVPRYLKVLWALSSLERKGLIKSKRIGFKKYYIINKEGL